MNGAFGKTYADAYDALYGEKDYAAECDLVERIFREYGLAPARSILDMGCGTGNHSLPLAARGYQVAGVDISEDMLERAREKAKDAPPEKRPEFIAGDIRQVDLSRRFDAALILFAVLGYQVDNADVLAALRTARRHLSPGGLLVFDVWHGPAVLTERPAPRTKEVPTPEGRIVRTTWGDLDTNRNLCTVHYRLQKFAGSLLVGQTEEDHRMRYFFPAELAFFLECADFSLLRLGAFPDFDRDPDEKTWNVLGVARAL